jgi:hypothetical protein
MAFHCGAPTREGSACQRHVRAVGMRCFQHAETTRLPGGRDAARGRGDRQDQLDSHDRPAAGSGSGDEAAGRAAAELAHRVRPAAEDGPWRPAVSANARSNQPKRSSDASGSNSSGGASRSDGASDPSDPSDANRSTEHPASRQAAPSAAEETQAVGGEPDMDVVTPSAELPRRKRVVPRRDSHELHVVEGDGSEEGIYLDLRPDALDALADQGQGAEVLRPRFGPVAAWREAPRDLSRFSDLLGLRDPRDLAGRPPTPAEAPRIELPREYYADYEPDDAEHAALEPYLSPGLESLQADSPPTPEYAERAEWLESPPERIQSARTPVWLPSMEYAAQADFLDSIPDLPMSPWAPRPSVPTEEYLVRAEQLEWLPERVGLTRAPTPEYAEDDDEFEDYEEADEYDGESAYSGGTGDDEGPPRWVRPSQLPEYSIGAERIEVEWLPPASSSSDLIVDDLLPNDLIPRDAIPHDLAPKHLIPERPIPRKPPFGRTPEQESRFPAPDDDGGSPEQSSRFSAPSLRVPFPPDPPVAPRSVRGPMEDELNIFASLPADDLDDLGSLGSLGDDGTYADHAGYPVYSGETGDDLTVPEFLVPGFGEVAQPAEHPLGAVLSITLGRELWRRCHVEWSQAHCAALARFARGIDGQAPSTVTSLRSTAGAGLRWLGATRDEDTLAARIADAIELPPRVSQTVEARTVRLYGVAICAALERSMRRCACHRDLMRDVSVETVRELLAEFVAQGG